MRGGIATGTAILSLLLLTTSTVAEPPEPYTPLPSSAFSEVHGSAPGIPDVRPSRVFRMRELTFRPTPTPPVHAITQEPILAHQLKGIATWYCLLGVSPCQAAHQRGRFAAAGPALRLALGPSWRGRVVAVSVPGESPIFVTLTDWCACPSGHTIDLYAEVFSLFKPLSEGTTDVTVSWKGTP